MKLRCYICAKGVTLCFAGVFALFLLTILSILEADILFIGMVEICFFFIIVLWLLISFYLFNSRVRRINTVIEQLDQKYLLGEVIPKPQNELDAVYYNIMKQISYSAVDAVESARIEKEQYCEYVENWIHEIKTPLTACSLILDNDGNRSKLRRELKCADNLTENILYYARLKNVQNDNIIKEFHVMPVIEAAIKNEMSLLIAAGISVETDGDFTVCSDDKALRFMITQLLVNTVKYCPGCQIRIQAEDHCITYSDNGIGIPSFDLRRVTERGFTGSNGRKYGTSTGMGLYIVKSLCDKLDIEFELESKQNEYTTIRLKYASLTKL